MLIGVVVSKVRGLRDSLGSLSAVLKIRVVPGAESFPGGQRLVLLLAQHVEVRVQARRVPAMVAELWRRGVRGLREVSVLRG